MNAGLPAWQELLTGIAEKVLPAGDLDFHEFHRLDLRDQAALLGLMLGDQDADLRSRVIEELESARYSLTHGLLAALPARELITTNFDTLFEAAMDGAQRPLAVLPRSSVRSGEPWLLKLHGSIDDPAKIVLTREDYLGAPSKSGALFGLVQALLLTKHMLFVGYSLRDEDFHQLVHEVRAARADTPKGLKFGTVLTLQREPYAERLWPDLESCPMVSTPAASDAEPAQQARQLQIFLDLLAHLCADVDAFLIDETYRSMLTDTEKRRAELVRQLVEHVQTDDWPLAKRFVKRFLTSDEPGTG
jgi:hypothetical protein